MAIHDLLGTGSGLPELFVAGIDTPVPFTGPGERSYNYQQQTTAKLERKIVINALILVETSDSRQSCLGKLANCLADAVGLNISFGQFGL